MQKWFCDTNNKQNRSLSIQYNNNLSVLLTLIVIDLNHNALSVHVVLFYHVKISEIKIIVSMNKLRVYFAIPYSMKQIAIVSAFSYNNIHNTTC